MQPLYATRDTKIDIKVLASVLQAKTVSSG